MTKQCLNCSKTFQLDAADLQFYKKITLPPPTHCPDCRCQRRMATRNERHFYPDQCDSCNKKIISLYSADKPYTIYCHDCWWSDRWDASEYGRSFDFTKPFFEQFAALQTVVPRANVLKAGGHIENSDYCSYIGDAKNCYLVAGSIFVEDCYYGNPYYSKNCVDSLLIRDCEQCYECITSENLYNCLYCQDCFDSNNLLYCYDCKGCAECIGCVGLRNQSYHIYNKKYSPEEYTRKKSALNLCDPNSVAEIQKNVLEQKLTKPRRFMMGLKNESVTGNYINESKNCDTCFDIKRCEQVKYSAQVIDLKDCYDCNYTEENELCYDYIGSWKDRNCYYSNTCFQCVDTYYSESCYSGQDLFGCVGLRNKRYCILNKQYSPEQYRALKAKIIEYMKSTGEWGEFFPVQASIFAYNETVAADYFPLTEPAVKRRHWQWLSLAQPRESHQVVPVPNEMALVSDDILQTPLACALCHKQYKIIQPELEFYRQKGLPIPQHCPDCRQLLRMKQRPPRAVWHRQCMCTQVDHKHTGRCGIEFNTAHPPESKDIIYCEQCYQKEIY